MGRVAGGHRNRIPPLPGAGIRRGFPILPALAVLLAGSLFPSGGWAYVPDVEDIFSQISASRPGISSAILETRSVVFDPFGTYTPSPSGLPHPDAPLPEAEGRAFRQVIYWIRGQLLGIETFSGNGKLLHFYLHEGYQPIQGNFDPIRVFADADILPPYLPFLAGDPAAWRQALSFWGLAPQSVELVRDGKGAMYFHLQEESGGGLWIDRDRLVAKRLESFIAGGERPRKLRIEFNEFVVLRGNNPARAEAYYPRTINFLLDGWLMKQTRLLSFRANPQKREFPITRLRKTARKLRREKGISLAGRQKPS